MARAIDVQAMSPQSLGFNQATGLRKTYPRPSLATGTTPVALADGAATGSPGAVLGTGQNPDLYTPPLETV